MGKWRDLDAPLVKAIVVFAAGDLHALWALRCTSTRTRRVAVALWRHMVATCRQQWDQLALRVPRSPVVSWSSALFSVLVPRPPPRHALWSSLFDALQQTIVFAPSVTGREHPWRVAAHWANYLTSLMRMRSIFPHVFMLDVERKRWMQYARGACFAPSHIAAEARATVRELRRLLGGHLEVLTSESTRLPTLPLFVRHMTLCAQPYACAARTEVLFAVVPPSEPPSAPTTERQLPAWLQAGVQWRTEAGTVLRLWFPPPWRHCKMDACLAKLVPPPAVQQPAVQQPAVQQLQPSQIVEAADELMGD